MTAKTAPKEVGRAPFTTKTDVYSNSTQVTLVFFDDGTVKWEPPVNTPGFPPIQQERLFPEKAKTI